MTLGVVGRAVKVVSRLVVAGAILAMPSTVSAQEAVVSGTVTDSTGAVLPGVTIRAVHAASGNSFEAVTDQRGAFRIAVRVGTYQLRAGLAGFQPVTRCRRAVGWSDASRGDQRRHRGSTGQR